MHITIIFVIKAGDYSGTVASNTLQGGHVTKFKQKTCTVCGNVQHMVFHDMTTGTDMLLFLSKTAVASWRHVLQAAAHFIG